MCRFCVLEALSFTIALVYTVILGKDDILNPLCDVTNNKHRSASTETFESVYDITKLL